MVAPRAARPCGWKCCRETPPSPMWAIAASVRSTPRQTCSSSKANTVISLTSRIGSFWSSYQPMAAKDCTGYTLKQISDGNSQLCICCSWQLHDLQFRVGTWQFIRKSALKLALTWSRERKSWYYQFLWKKKIIRRTCVWLKWGMHADS